MPGWAGPAVWLQRSEGTDDCAMRVRFNSFCIANERNLRACVGGSGCTACRGRAARGAVASRGQPLPRGLTLHSATPLSPLNRVSLSGLICLKWGSCLAVLFVEAHALCETGNWSLQSSTDQPEADTCSCWCSITAFVLFGPPFGPPFGRHRPGSEHCGAAAPAAPAPPGRAVREGKINDRR